MFQAPKIALCLSLLFGALAAAPDHAGAAAPARKSATKPAAKGKPASKRPAAKGKKAGPRKVARQRVPRRKVFLERRVVAMKGNLPNVQSLGALVIDLDTNKELYARKPDAVRAIASISKLAAALVVMDRRLPLGELTTMKRVDSEVARGGAPSRLLEGMTLSNRDLLHAALMGSDNRAVSALGRAVDLNSAALASAMNRKVAALGLRATRFREPTGLSPENVSTPRETLVLLAAAMAHPVLGPILLKQEYDAHPVGRPPIHYVSTHKPANRSHVEVLGGKTGYNDPARYCLVLAARVNGRRYGMALLGTEGKLTRFGDVARVADWIVSHVGRRSATAALPVSAAPAPAGNVDAAAPDGAACARSPSLSPESGPAGP